MSSTSSSSSSSSSSRSRGCDVGEVETIDDDEINARKATEEEIAAYAVFIGIDPETEPHLLWIAKKGVSAPVPKPWKECREGDETFYFNFETEESKWDHPCDDDFKNLVEKWRPIGPGSQHNTGSQQASNCDESKKSGSACSFDDDSPVSVDEPRSERVKDDWVKPKPASAVADDSESTKPAAEVGLAGESRDQGSGSLTGGADGGSGSFLSELIVGTDDSVPMDSEQFPATTPPGEAVCKVGLAGTTLRPPALLDHGAGSYSARSSVWSEVSEDFRSDWGAPSPAISARSGTGAREGQSLEVSVSIDQSQDEDRLRLPLGAPSRGVCTTVTEHDENESDKTPVHNMSKTLTELELDVKALSGLLSKVVTWRENQDEFLRLLLPLI